MGQKRNEQKSNSMTIFELKIKTLKSERKEVIKIGLFDQD